MLWARPRTGQSLLSTKTFNTGIIQAMHHFKYNKKELFCERTPLSRIAKEVGTPFYVYSHATLLHHFKAFDGAFDNLEHLTCFSVKSNSNLAILRLFASRNSGVDIVSGGELFRATKAGIPPGKIVYSGVGKTVQDIKYALDTGILMFNVESTEELKTINRLARAMNKRAPIAFRVNPDVDPKTHPYISTGMKENKFGIDIHEAYQKYLFASSLDHISVIGVSCHIGSQLTDVSPLTNAIKKLIQLIRRLKNNGINIKYLDIGGGLGITYRDEKPPHPAQYAKAIQEELKDMPATLILEPGRVIVGNAGALVTRITYKKSNGDKTFYIVDAGMNDLMRPSLYNAYHDIWPVSRTDREQITVDIVGPICESGDFFAKKRKIAACEPGEMLAIMSAGAYGFTMASNYNSRPRLPEVMVKEDRFYLIRERETFNDLVRGEHIPDFLR